MTFEQTFQRGEEVLYANIYRKNIPGMENNPRYLRIIEEASVTGAQRMRERSGRHAQIGKEGTVITKDLLNH